MALDSAVHCQACDGTGIVTPASAVALEYEVREFLSTLPSADIMGKGQWFFDPKTIVRLVMYMYLKGDVEGRRIACVASPTIGVGLELFRQAVGLSSTKVVTIDIDEDVLERVQNRFPHLEALVHDISFECPRELLGQFDTFFFDPVYSEDHYAIGLSRCVELLGAHALNKTGYLVIPPPEIAPTKADREKGIVPLQITVFRIINEMSLCVTEMKSNFVHYTTPPAEAEIFSRRGLGPKEETDSASWRGSDLVRIASTVATEPLHTGQQTLSTRINRSRRVGVARDYVPLSQIETQGGVCSLCPRCFSSYVEDQRKWSYSGYWPARIYTRPMMSWRDANDQPFEVAPACAAFVNTKAGELVMLQGPAAKAIWETLTDITGILRGEPLSVEEIVRQSIPDFEEIKDKQVLESTREFMDELIQKGLVDSALIEDMG